MIVRYTKKAVLSLLAWMICWNLHAQLERENMQILMDRFDLLAVKTGDMDGDGDEDVVATCNAWDGHIAVFENLDGQGDLAWPRLYGDSIWAGSRNFQGEFELADMDQDGDLDVVDAYRARETVPYWANDGLGHLQPGSSEPYEYGPVKPYERFKVGDVNGDGWLDIVIGLDADVVWVNLSAGNGQTFSPELAYSDVVHHPSLVDMELADVDQDGDLDIYILGSYQTDQSVELKLQVLEWTGSWYSHMSRSFLEVEWDKWAFFDCDMSIIDIDTNGFPDAVYTHTGNGFADREYMVYLQVAPFTGGANLVWQSEGQPFVSHVVADIDQDDDEDLLAYYIGSGYYRITNDSGILNSSPILLDTVLTGRSLSAGDLNSDGSADLLTYGEDNAFSFGTEHIFTRPGPLNSNPSPPLQLTRATNFLRDIQHWDWDADGYTDVLFCDDTGIAWLRNQGGGQNYSPPATVWASPYLLSHFEFAQLDGDDLPDGVGTTRVSNIGQLPVIWRSTGDTLAFPEFELRHGRDFDVADADGDGDQDVALLTRESGVVLLWNTGGGFTPQVVIEDNFNVTYEYSTILMDDFDFDGAADLVLQLNTGVYFARHLDGAGQFSNLQEIEGMDEAGALFSGDYDLDGRQDLRGRYSTWDVPGVLLMSSYDTIEQAFTPVVERGIIGNSFSISEALVNTDSLPDYITGRGLSFNVGTSGFVATPFLPPPFENSLPPALYQNACRADLDGDGTTELITGSQEIIVYQPSFSSQQLVQGQLVWDTTFNCTFNPDWPGMPNGQLLLEGQDGFQQVLSTTTAGDYGGYLPDTLPHTLSPILPSDYWVACPPDTLLQGTGPHEADFAVSAAVSCPLMELELSMEPVRQCFNSSVVLRYENTGTASSDSASVQLVFDSRMTPVSATIPWSTQTDTSLTFDLGVVAVGGSGQIIVELSPDCQELILGEVLCYRASITPDTLCDPGLVGWEGGNLEARFTCGTDSLEWRIENTGYGPVSMPVPYELSIVNDDIVLLENGDVEILPGEFVLLTAPIDSSAYLLEAGQPDGHPAPEPIRMLSSGCITALDTGLVLAFPNNNGDPFTVEQCEPVIGAYDPNIKGAYPAGFGTEHHIPAEEELQYTIHFQNVGTDMARNVTIRDTISPELDLSTFRAAGGSHEHQWYMLPDRVLVIEYPEILLPDSTSNEPESHGFFSFSIQPMDGVLPGTLIENRAGIYFDFNPPVITNTVFHTIEKPEVASTVYATVCRGDLYLDQVMMADTILEERYIMTWQDSVVWHHVNVLMPDDTTVVMVSLPESGWWQGIEIAGDTSIVEVYTSTAGCDSTVLYAIDVITALEETLGAKGDWLLSPNPAQDECWLNAPTQAAVPERIRLFNTQGQVIRTYDLRAARLPLCLPLQGLSEGLYWVELQGAEERQMIPLSIIRKN